MSPLAKQDTGSKTHYIIKMGKSYCVDRRKPSEYGSTGFDFGTLTTATKFDTLPKALDRLAQSYSGGGMWNIVRVTETPAGPSTIRLVSTRTIDAMKPVVLFNAKRQVYLRVGAPNALYVATDIQSATVFTDLGEAIRAEAENLRDILRRGSRPLEPLDTVHVHQVEVIPGTPTVTETVLA